jgi:fumarate reductase subunit D
MGQLNMDIAMEVFAVIGAVCVIIFLIFCIFCGIMQIDKWIKKLKK